MSTASLADDSLHVCSRQVLFCARLAACHVPLVNIHDMTETLDVYSRWALIRFIGSIRVREIRVSEIRVRIYTTAHPMPPQHF